MLLRLLCFFILIFYASADCLRKICNLESGGCRNLPCKWDDDAVSCGYYQLKLIYYTDCGMPWKRPGESAKSAWKRCAGSKPCSEQCIRNYVNRYRSLCPGRSACEQMARLHNGGPYGCTPAGRRKTDEYWRRIQNTPGLFYNRFFF